MPSGRTVAVVAACALAASLADAARVEVPLLLAGESVRATLDAAGDAKVVSFAGVEGSTLDVRAVAAPGSRVIPRITVVAPDGVPLGVGDTNPRATGRAQARGIALPASGVWRLRVETPPGHGGAFVLSAKARTPLRSSWTGTIGTNAAVHEIPAAPGGTMSVVVTSSSDGAAFDPDVDLLAPSGAVVAHASGAQGRASVRHAPLDELGRYRVRVSGGPGSFSAKASVQPAKRRRPAFRDVASTPDVSAVLQTSSPNQTLVTLFLDGVGFTDVQTLSITDGVNEIAAGAVQPFGYAKAAAVLDLGNVAPGTYTVLVTTPGTNRTVAAGSFVVTNRTPSITSAGSTDVPASKPFSFEVAGSGFDSTAALFLRFAADGAEVPLVVTSRKGHERIVATATPPSYRTGRCDVEVRDPDGGHAVAAGVVDLLGYREPPTTLRSWTGTGPAVVHADDAAYDDERGRVLVAVRRQPGLATFTLFDPSTQTATDTLEIAAADVGGGALMETRVARDAKGDTFVICLGSAGSPAYGVVRVVSAADIHHTLLETRVTPDDVQYMSRIDAAAASDGGYLVVWDQVDPIWGRRIRAQSVSAAATTDASAVQTVAWSPAGNIADPTVACQGPGRFVVAWAGLSLDGLGYAVRATVTDAAGAQVPGLGPLVTATSRSWAAVARPELAAGPGDGSMLLAFWYAEGAIYRPACQRLAPVNVAPGPQTHLDDGFAIPGGGVAGVVWNAARGEFVAATVSYDQRVALRRVDVDGSLRPASSVESYEGTTAALWAGSATETLGLVRGFDGTADGVHDPSSTTVAVTAGRVH